MTEIQPKTGKFALNYGLILGAISIVFGVMLFSLDMHTDRSWQIQVVGLILTIIVIALGIYQFKKANAGFLSLSQAMKIGVGITLIATLLGIAYQLVLANFLDPQFVDKVMEIQMSEAIANGSISADQAKQQIEMGKKFFWIGYPIYMVISLFVGLVISLIVGLIMQKRNTEY